GARGRRRPCAASRRVGRHRFGERRRDSFEASRGRLRFELAKSPLPCTTSITTERSKPRGSRSDHARRTAADSDGCDYDGQPYAYSVSRGWPAYGTPFVKWMRIVV